MSADERRKGGRRRSGRLRALLACGIALGLGSIGTFASWSTGASIAPGSIKAAQLDVVADGQLASSTNRDGTYTKATWAVDDLLPGEVVAVSFTVSNAGVSEMPFDLRMDAYVEGTLGSSLRFQFYNGGTPSASTPLTSVQGDTYRQGSCSGGTQFLGSTALGVGAGNATPIVTTKQRMNVGDTRSYCVLIALPEGSSVYSDTGILNQKATLVMILRGTQEGAP